MDFAWRAGGGATTGGARCGGRAPRAARPLVQAALNAWMTMNGGTVASSVDQADGLRGLG